MTAVAARELRDGEVCVPLASMPNLACNLAPGDSRTESGADLRSGAVGAVPERLPVSIGDPALVTGSLMVCSMADVFSVSCRMADPGRSAGWRTDRSLRKHQHHRRGRLCPSHVRLPERRAADAVQRPSNCRDHSARRRCFPSRWTSSPAPVSGQGPDSS